MNDMLENERIGRWTRTDTYIRTERGERKILCRCDCGTERYVLERSLKSGGSLSCGCLTRENAKKKNSYDLTDRSFGELTALYPAAVQRKNGGIWWTCRCSCGNVCDIPATLLVKGRKMHCGCQNEKEYYSVDISGRSFYRLTALYPLDKRAPQGSVMWHCRCECGKELDVSYNELMYSNIRSCGCQKKEHDAKMQGFLTRFSGTSLDMLKSNKIFSSNTSGAKGVYLIKGKWTAKIVFQQKAYYLGSYKDFETAVRARKEAEDLLFQGTVEHYEKWRRKADEEPLWAIEHPFDVMVSKNADGKIAVTYYPFLGE